MMAETFVRQRPVKAVQGIPASGTPFAACELRAAGRSSQAGPY